jgi:hypothetical protein
MRSKVLVFVFVSDPSGRSESLPGVGKWVRHGAGWLRELFVRIGR